MKIKAVKLQFNFTTLTYNSMIHYMFNVHIIYYTYHETDIDDDMKVYVFQILFTLKLDIQIIPLSF